MLKIQNKRVKETIFLFSLFFVVIITLILPLYKISYDSMKSKINVETEHKINQLTEFIDAEIMACHKMKISLKNNPTYNTLKTMEKLEFPRQYILLKEFQEDFNSKTNMMFLSDHYYIFFSNNNIAINKKNAFDNIEPVFNNYIKMDDMNYSQFSEFIFDSESGVYVKYTQDLEIEGKKSPSVVIIYPMELYKGSAPDSVVVVLYEIKSLFEKMDMSAYEDIFSYISVNDMPVITDGTKADDSKNFVAKCENVDLTIKVKLSKQYLNGYMKQFRRFVFIYFLVLLLAVAALEVFIAWYSDRHVRNMVRYISKILGNNSIYCEEDIFGIVRQLKSDNDAYNDNFLSGLFIKTLDPEEIRFVKSKYPDFPEPYSIMLIYSELVNQSVLELLFHQFGIHYKLILSNNDRVYAVIFDFNDRELKNKLDDMVYSMKSGGIDIVAILSGKCETISEFYSAYYSLNEYRRLIDHNGLFVLDNSNIEASDVIIKAADYTMLREYIMCGRCEEAKRLVYEFWYCAMENVHITNSEIERMFYTQINILSDIALKVNYQYQFTKYDSGIKIDELAFKIADDVEAICNHVNTKAENYDAYDSIMSFIDQSFKDTEFGIPYVESKFNITGKTVNKIVKSKTGKTFSQYVEEKRLDLVKDMMLNSEFEIKVIAENCGFQNYDTFYKFFKKHTGVSPLKWKSMNKSNIEQ